jgi:hypothetical protein
VSERRLGKITGDPWVEKQNPRPPREKPTPLQRVKGFPRSRAGVFSRVWGVLEGSRTLMVAGFVHTMEGINVYKCTTTSLLQYPYTNNMRLKVAWLCRQGNIPPWLQIRCRVDSESEVLVAWGNVGGRARAELAFGWQHVDSRASRVESAISSESHSRLYELGGREGRSHVTGRARHAQ